MNKFFTLQIASLIIISGSLGGMLVFTDVYEEVKNGIVSVLCLSCLKLNPKTKTDFIFETANEELHPKFIKENLSKGIIFLHYSEDACVGCDIMYPIIKDLFDIEFGKEDIFYDSLEYKNINISYYYINIDHTTKEFAETFPIYDKDYIRGLPMFTIITLGYDDGNIKPYYTTLYGTLGLDNYDDRYNFLDELIEDSQHIYHQNSDGYDPDN